MLKTLSFLKRFLIFIILTILTQIGGVIYFFCLILFKSKSFKYYQKALIFSLLYLFFTFLIIPKIAPQFGREKIKNTENIKPTNVITVLLNRNYVRPELNEILKKTSQNLIESKCNIELKYLDANFPFINNFPLLPHLSHNDGRKIDLSLIYQMEEGEISNSKKSISGYGVFEEPFIDEINTTNNCKSDGYIQYDFSKYLTLGKINNYLVFSGNGTKLLVETILKNPEIEKIFIEPHLKNRLKLTNNKIRFHGCGAVRHDDHIHIQIK